MLSVFSQSVIPFFLSALIVVIITVVAEKYGTKVGGILGTLPSTIVIAFLFIALNKGVDFAARAVAVVPAELGINLLFLFVFSLYAKRSSLLAFVMSLLTWAVCSYVLFLANLSNIVVSVGLYLGILVCTFLVLEYGKHIESQRGVHIHYTPVKILFRGVLAGTVIAITVLLSNVNAVLSGIFSVFPAILSSTMFIFVRDHSPEFAAGMAKSMMVGISSVCTYAIVIHFLYPLVGIWWGTLGAYLIALLVTIIIFRLRGKIR